MAVTLGEMETRRDLPPLCKQSRDPRTGLVVERLERLVDRRV